MSAWEQLLATVVYPALALAVTGMVPIFCAVIARRLGLQIQATQDQASALRDHAAQAAITGMVATFAGKVVGEIAEGKLTLESVRNGAAAKALVDYAAGTVGDSLIRHGVTPDTLSTMLIGRVNALVAPAVVAASPPVPASVP